MIERVVSHGLLFGILATISTACSVTHGSVLPHDMFFPPNSKVHVIGPVSAEETKTRFLGFGAQFDPEEALAVHRKALAKQPGANVIVNISSDVTTTAYPFVLSVTYRVSGNGAEVLVYDPSAGK